MQGVIWSSTTSSLILNVKSLVTSRLVHQNLSRAVQSAFEQTLQNFQTNSYFQTQALKCLLLHFAKVTDATNVLGCLKTGSATYVFWNFKVQRKLSSVHLRFNSSTNQNRSQFLSNQKGHANVNTEGCLQNYFFWSRSI